MAAGSGLHASHRPEHAQGARPGGLLAGRGGPYGRRSRRRADRAVPRRPPRSGLPEGAWSARADAGAALSARSRRHPSGVLGDDASGGTPRPLPPVAGRGAGSGSDDHRALRHDGPQVPHPAGCAPRPAAHPGADRRGRERVPAPGVRSGLRRVGEGPRRGATLAAAVPLPRGSDAVAARLRGALGGRLAIRQGAAHDQPGRHRSAVGQLRRQHGHRSSGLRDARHHRTARVALHRDQPAHPG